MTKEQKLKRMRFHWVLYVKYGGISKPKSDQVGDLHLKGLIHWNAFLQLGKQYLMDYPKDAHILEGFVPSGTVKLLAGE